MSERLHPGVYVEERTTGLAPIQGVSTSNMGIVGFTTEGPTNEAVLVTSFTQFKNRFGDFTADSQVPTHAYAFFANSGRRTYVVRVVGAGAVDAGGHIKDDITDEIVDATPDGVLVVFGGTLANIPVVPGSITLKFNEPGTPIVAEASDMSPVPTGAIVDFTGKLGAAADTPIVPGTVAITSIIAVESYEDSAADGTLREAGSPAVIVGWVDYLTGHFVVTMATAPVNAADVTYDYTPVGTLQIITDDGVGGWTGTAVTLGTIVYATGVWTLDVTGFPPHDNDDILADYTYENWPVAASSAGVWGNNVRVDVDGDNTFWDRTTASFTRHRILVNKRPDATSDFELKETFNDLTFVTTTDPRYAPTLLGTTGIGSDLIDLSSTPVNVTFPKQLHGILNSRACGGADNSQDEFGSSGATPTIPQPFVTDPLDTTDGIQPGSITITWYDALGVVRTIIDDGDGNLTGQIDPGAAVGFNVIDYATGEFAFATGDGLIAEPPADVVVNGINALLQIQWYTTPVVTTEQETLTSGTDGAAVTRTELTSPTLLATRDGMYALLVPDELINLVVPDAAGNTTMSLDETTECERNNKWFSILATGPGLTPQEAQDYRLNKLGYTGSFAALYYPHITIADPVTDLPTNIPAGGHIAGIYARTDNAANVATAPAGVNRGKLSFAIGLERDVEFAEIDILHPFEVNTLIDKTQTGRVVWGARTLERPASDFTYIQVRRLFNFLNASIFNSTHGFVFENIGADLRVRITLSIESFLANLFDQGYFAGESKQDAFNVVCDETNNTAATEASGTVICDIFVAPQKPGEFIVFRIQQKIQQA